VLYKGLWGVRGEIVWREIIWDGVSILVLMDGWVKTETESLTYTASEAVSILVLMDGWVKTRRKVSHIRPKRAFQSLF